jgi:hypothetical protein
MPSVIFLASPKSIIVKERLACPEEQLVLDAGIAGAMPRLTKSTVPALSTSRIGMP